MDSNETKIYVALLIATGILGVFLIFFIVTIIRYQRRNQMLQKEKTTAEISTLERERTRIASDLHDDLGPVLSAVKLLINNVDLPSAEDAETLARATQYIDRTLLQLRTISNNLMPQALIRKGLLVAVDEFVRERPARGKLNIRFSFAEEIRVEPEQGIHLYRIILEIIHNAEKHAGASEMTICLTNHAHFLRLELKDNGKGFDAKDKLTTQRGLGLKNILSRVDTLKGNIYLDSEPKKGTAYTIEIPTASAT